MNTYCVRVTISLFLTVLTRQEVQKGKSTIALKQRGKERVGKQMQSQRLECHSKRAAPVCSTSVGSEYILNISQTTLPNQAQQTVFDILLWNVIPECTSTWIWPSLILQMHISNPSVLQHFALPHSHSKWLTVTAKTNNPWRMTTKSSDSMEFCN